LQGKFFVISFIVINITLHMV